MCAVEEFLCRASLESAEGVLCRHLDLSFSVPKDCREMAEISLSSSAVLPGISPRNYTLKCLKPLPAARPVMSTEAVQENNKLKREVQGVRIELKDQERLVDTMKQRVRESENDLNNFKAKMMLHEVNTVRHSNGTKKMIYLTNKEADLITTDERISKMLYDFDLPRYHLVVNLVTCRGLAHHINGAKPLGQSADDSEKGILNYSGILDAAETMKAEEELEMFMEKVVIPMAIEHKALVICDTSVICSITTAFTRAVKTCREEHGGKLPFTILASTYAISVHLRTSEKGSFEQRLMESSETWKRSSHQLKEGVERYREVEGKKILQEFVLQNIGNLSVNDELSHYIFVEGIDDAAKEDTDRRPKMSSGQDTAWVRLLSKIFDHLVSNTPTVGLCTQQATQTTYPRLVALLKNKVPVLMIDLRPRDFKPAASIDDDKQLREQLRQATSKWVDYEKGIRNRKVMRCEQWDMCTLAYLHSFLNVKKQDHTKLDITRSIKTSVVEARTEKKTVVESFPTEADILGVCEAIAINPKDGKKISKDAEKWTQTLTMLKDSNFWSCHVSEDLDEVARNKNLFQALVMSEMVEPVRDKKMVFLSNWQTQHLIEHDDGVTRLLSALGIQRPKLVINLINCRGVDHHDTALGASLHQSPIRDHDLVVQQEDDLKRFMKRVVIRVAVENEALVLCDTSTTCSMSMAFSQALKQLIETEKDNQWFKDKCKDGQLPFSILGTTYACAVHKRASNPRGQDIVSEVFKASRVWKKSEKMLSEAIETFKKDEKSNDSKIPQFILDNFGNLAVNDQLTHYIFVDGMEMKLQGDGRQVPTLQMGPGTPWVKLINKIMDDLVSKHPSVSLCTQEPGGTSNARLEQILGKESASVLLMDLRERDAEMLSLRAKNLVVPDESSFYKALNDWHKRELKSVFRDGAHKDNQSKIFAELWDYCSLAYLRGFLVPANSVCKRPSDVIKELEFPMQKHFDMVVSVLLHQKKVEMIHFRLKQELADVTAKKQALDELEKKAEKGALDKLTDEEKQKQAEVDKLKLAARIKNAENLEEMLSKAGAFVVNSKQSEPPTKFQRVLELAQSTELKAFWEAKDNDVLDKMKKDLTLILTSWNVHSCLIGKEQRDVRSETFENNRKLFYKLTGQSDAQLPKLRQSGSVAAGMQHISRDGFRPDVDPLSENGGVLCPQCQARIHISAQGQDIPTATEESGAQLPAPSSPGSSRSKACSIM